MRLSSLFLANLLLAIMLFVPIGLLAQHSGGGHSSSSAGSSSGGSSSHSFSPANSVSGAGSSHSTGATTSNGSGKAGSSSASSKNGAQSSATSQKKTFFSFLHHKKTPPSPSVLTAAWRPIRCEKGENCFTCPSGVRNASGLCLNQTQYSCSAGQAWNGFSCGAQILFNGCREIEEALQMQRLRMRDATDPVEGLRYQLLLNQYEQCMRQFGREYFSSSSFGDLSLYAIP
jgi:hypothetical protein